VANSTASAAASSASSTGPPISGPLLGLPSAGVAVVLLVLYVVMSLVTYVVYTRDKSAAGARRRRVPENTLHLLSLVCGWPGAFVAQRRLRHKTRKTSFLVVFWLTVLANLAALAATLWIVSTSTSSFAL
jgi:uncharacterized membrane protein YsdA (DUF1294 family)